MCRNGASWSAFCRRNCAAACCDARRLPRPLPRPSNSPALAPFLVGERPVARKLSGAAVESLAILAYPQPVTRAEIEAIRGVALARGTLDRLLEASWVRPRGRRDSPGRPLTWATTPTFL